MNDDTNETLGVHYVYNVVKAGKRTFIREFPLFDKHGLCPTARYVGGTSKYLCECINPYECEGVLAVAKEATKHDDSNP